MIYSAANDRYSAMSYRRVGHSGLKLPEISLGLWHNFGGVDTLENCRAMLLRAFDRGVTHFDLANNYGPPPGSAESTFGQILQQDLAAYRDQLIISTKAGYYMWEGPYGEWGSKKNLMASLHQSLRRMQLDYVDIFYSHRFDPETPLEETISALDLMVRQGKTLYVGISNYGPEQTAEAIRLFQQLGTPFIIHQAKYNMLHRDPEHGLLNTLRQHQKGCIAFSPLAQGMLTDKYLQGIPADSRAARPSGFLQASQVTDQVRHRVAQLNTLAQERGQSLAQMALVWLLRDPVVSSVLIGASRVTQLDDSLNALHNKHFTQEEYARIEAILNA